MNINLIPQSDILHVIVTGEFSILEAKRTFLEVLDVVEESGYKMVFFDGRELSGNPTTIERFYYGDFVAGAVEELLERGSSLGKPRFAYLMLEPLLDPLRLGETIALKRGMDLRAFDERDEALQWLSSKRDGSN